ncbi:MAG: radical SAM protein, partial [Candidatus Aenigmarchaeota archaeon]|nr:radical SAM protein [Candidatus Aenigmarchaeota archaeon]
MGRRLDVKVGWRCNNNCIFCAQAHKRHLGDLSTEEVKKRILEGWEDGCDELVLTGGEPTIRKDIFELVRYAHELGFKIIQIQSNGRMFYYKDFVKKIIEAGANEFSPAIHGHNPLIHESQTRAKGSFKQTYEGIKNLKEFGQYVITNT